MARSQIGKCNILDFALLRSFRQKLIQTFCIMSYWLYTEEIHWFSQPMCRSDFYRNYHKSVEWRCHKWHQAKTAPVPQKKVLTYR